MTTLKAHNAGQGSWKTAEEWIKKEWTNRREMNFKQLDSQEQSVWS